MNDPAQWLEWIRVGVLIAGVVFGASTLGCAGWFFIKNRMITSSSLWLSVLGTTLLCLAIWQTIDAKPERLSAEAGISELEKRLLVFVEQLQVQAEQNGREVKVLRQRQAAFDQWLEAQAAGRTSAAQGGKAPNPLSAVGSRLDRIEHNVNTTQLEMQAHQVVQAKAIKQVRGQVVKLRSQLQEATQTYFEKIARVQFSKTAQRELLAKGLRAVKSDMARDLVVLRRELNLLKHELQVVSARGHR